MCKTLLALDDILNFPWVLGLYFPSILSGLSPFIPSKTEILISELAAAANTHVGNFRNSETVGIFGCVLA